MQHVHKVLRLADTHLRGEVHLRLAGLAALCRDDDYAVTGLGAVDGGRSGILHDLDVLDVNRVQVVEQLRVRGRIAVDHVQRVVAAVDRAVTADADRRGGARSTVHLLQRDTRGHTCEGLRHRGVRHLGDLVALDRGNGRRDGALGDGTVTHGHRLLQQQAVVLQHDVEVGSRSHPLGDIADAGDFEGRARSDPDREPAVDVGDDTVGGAGHDDGGADDRLSGLVLDST